MEKKKALSAAQISTVMAEVRAVLAENVSRERISQGLSQEQLAARAGFHRTYVSQVELCRTNITIDSLVKLALALEISPNELLQPSRPA